jgi:hypothetical protein
MFAETSISSMVWAFINSPVGVSIVGGAFLWLLARVFAWRPQWERYHDQYKGLLISAVRHAEKAIPDDSPNKTAQRADAALKYVLGVHAHLKEKDVSQALSVVHDDMEGTLRAKKKS